MFQGCFVDFRFGFRFSVHLRVRALWVIFAGMYIYIYTYIYIGFQSVGRSTRALISR